MKLLTSTFIFVALFTSQSFASDCYGGAQACFEQGKIPSLCSNDCKVSCNSHCVSSKCDCTELQEGQCLGSAPELSCTETENLNCTDPVQTCLDQGMLAKCSLDCQAGCFTSGKGCVPASCQCIPREVPGSACPVVCNSCDPTNRTLTECYYAQSHQWVVPTPAETEQIWNNCIDINPRETSLTQKNCPAPSPEPFVCPRTCSECSNEIVVCENGDDLWYLPPSDYGDWIKANCFPTEQTNRIVAEGCSDNEPGGDPSDEPSPEASASPYPSSTPAPTSSPLPETTPAPSNEPTSEPNPSSDPIPPPPADDGDDTGCSISDSIIHPCDCGIFPPSVCGPGDEDPNPSDEPNPSVEPTPTDEPAPSGEPAPTDEGTPSGEPAPTDEGTPSGEPAPTDEASPSAEPAPSGDPEIPPGECNPGDTIVDSGICKLCDDNGYFQEVPCGE